MGDTLKWRSSNRNLQNKQRPLSWQKSLTKSGGHEEAAARKLAKGTEIEKAFHWYQ